MEGSITNIIRTVYIRAILEKNFTDEKRESIRGCVDMA